MKKICLLFMLSFLSSCLISASQNSAITPGEQSYFPLITGANLNGQNYNLPKDFSGKINIVTIGFEREHQIAIDAWIPQIQKVFCLMYRYKSMFRQEPVEKKSTLHGRLIGIKICENEYKRVMRISNPDSGFTLIELLVVVALMATIASRPERA